jgi:hypothetical protein
MAKTTSLSFPNMFDIARNKVGVIEDNVSIVNRCRLLILTEPTSLYNNPRFGVGLKRHLWKYNTINEKTLIQDRIKDQLNIYEPCCDADKTVFSEGLLTNTAAEQKDLNALKMTVGIQTVYGDALSLSLNENEGV